jgi:hypothetical protein
MKILLSFILMALAFVPNYAHDSQTQLAKKKSFKTKIKGHKVIGRDKTKSVRREFKAIFARQIANYKAQFEAVKSGEKLKPDCGANFVLKNLNGSTITCEQITAERQAKFKRIKRINYLKIEIGNIEVNGNEAIVYTTQSFSRIIPDANDRDQTIVTDGTIHKEFWTKDGNGWKSNGFEEIKQGSITINGHPYSPPR